MKKIISHVCAMPTIAILLITVAIHFTACKKECNTCVVQSPDAIEKIAFTLMDKSFQTEFEIYKMNVAGKNRECIDRNKPDENLFQFIKEYCYSNHLPVDNQTMAFVLYYDLPISPVLAVTDEYIKGISLYYVEKNKIMHQLFVKNEHAEFYEIENTKVAVPYVTHNHCHYYLENYVFKVPQNKSYIMVMGSLAEKVWKDKKRYYNAPMRYEARTSTKAMQPQPGGDCPLPCTYGVGTCVSGPYGSGCTSEAPFNCVAQEMQESILKDHAERMLIDLDLMYAFRDDVLYHSEKGEVYIDNYYYLSEEYDGKIGLALAIKSALILKDFNPVMRAFINPEEHLKEVLFTDDLSTSLLGLLDEYEKITSSSEGKAILASIRKDVHSLKNKQLQEILAMIK